MKMENFEMDSTADNIVFNLDSLPVEILLHIFQYLDGRFVRDVISRVSKYFRDIVEDEACWRLRIQKKWTGQYPAVPPPSSFSWSSACIEREEEEDLWLSGGSEMRHQSNASAHFASLDAVHVMDDVIVSGSRDRGICLWSTKNILECKPVAKYPDSHKGWVWTLCSQDDLLISGAWDNTVKFWKMTNSEMATARQGIKLKTAVLTTDIHENRIVAGTFDKKIIQMDTREENKKITFYQSHSKPVLAAKITERHILSLSEDGLLAVHDRVAAKRLKRVRIPTETFPMSMSILNNMVYVGDSSGCLHLLDATLDSFEVVETYQLENQRKVSCVQAGLGAVMTSSSNGFISIYSPSRNLDLITKLKVENVGEIAHISYKNGVLAAASSNNSIHIWSRK